MARQVMKKEGKPSSLGHRQSVDLENDKASFNLEVTFKTTFETDEPKIAFFVEIGRSRPCHKYLDEDDIYFIYTQ